MRVKLAWGVVTVITVGLLMLFNYWAPWQFESMAAYSGIVLLILGTACTVVPFRVLEIGRRRTGAVIGVTGLALAVGALLWPASLKTTSQYHSRFDARMPQYHFSERHTIKVHAAPPEVLAALQQTTLADLAAMEVLTRIRSAALGGDLDLGASQKPLVDAGFLRLDQDDREVVLAMAGRPWANAVPKLHDPAEFESFNESGSVKIALNFRVEYLGNGWSSVITETRVLGIGTAGRRRMSPYWRLIVPGSGLIRRQWLSAIRERAEHRASSQS
ncbi:MAG TPA: hypothetical protein VD837_18405 [Terriglobales bacterium]|nr:hypothetical protein [Terriglobales bacterium]